MVYHGKKEKSMNKYCVVANNGDASDVEADGFAVSDEFVVFYRTTSIPDSNYEEGDDVACFLQPTSVEIQD